MVCARGNLGEHLCCSVVRRGKREVDNATCTVALNVVVEVEGSVTADRVLNDFDRATVGQVEENGKTVVLQRRIDGLRRPGLGHEERGAGTGRTDVEDVQVQGDFVEVGRVDQRGVDIALLDRAPYRGRNIGVVDGSDQRPRWTRVIGPVIINIANICRDEAADILTIP